MKKLEELGISPAPWKVGGSAFDVVNATDEIITDDYDQFSRADAHLIAAAPKLYDVCYRAQQWEDYAKAHNKAIEPWKDIMHDMRAALAKASGESEARHV